MNISLFLRYTAIILVVLRSGANYINFYISPTLNSIIYLLFAILFFAYIKPKGAKYSLKVAFFICLWIILEQIFIQTGVKTNYYFTYLINYVSTVLIVSSFSFEEFRQKLLKVIQYLSLISIIVHELYLFGFIGGTHHYYPGVTDVDVTTALYVFNVGWGENRLSSVFWEPGQYQLILNFTLVLCANDIMQQLKGHEIKVLVKRYFILVLALILTNSTMGYLAFALFCTAVAFNYLDKKHIISGVIILTLMAICATLLLKSDVVGDKFAQKNEIKDTSYSIRMADNLSMLQMMCERPITGYGIETVGFEKRSLSLGNRTSSNGWLCAGSQLGFPFLVALLVLVWNGVKLITKGVSKPILFFLVIILSQSNEFGFALPYLSLFVFRFKDHSLLALQQLRRN